jgi:hypothetical protein
MAFHQESESMKRILLLRQVKLRDLRKPEVEVMKITICAFALCFLCSVCSGQTWSTLPVDVLVSMNTSTPGTPLTATIANAGTVSNQCTVGTQCTWDGSPGPPQGSAFTVGANQGVLTNLGPVQMTGTGGVLYPASSLKYNNIAQNDSNNTNSYFAMSGGSGTNATSTSILFGITIGEPYIANGDDWDIAGIWLGTGQYYEVQLNNYCNSPGEFGVRIENGHPTTHSATCIALVPQHSYFMSISANFTAGTSTLYVYTVEGSLVGSTTATTTDTGGTLYYIQIGNNESGSNSGTYTYFQNLMINWTTAPNPFFWTGGTVLQPPTNLTAAVQ